MKLLSLLTFALALLSLIGIWVITPEIVEFGGYVQRSAIQLATMGLTLCLAYATRKLLA